MLTTVFTSLVFSSVTQGQPPAPHLFYVTIDMRVLITFYIVGIAVDDWALLSEDNLSYTATCQTIGLNAGYSESFTVFLALNSDAFWYAFLLP
jgi:hypothetical protein